MGKVQLHLKETKTFCENLPIINVYQNISEWIKAETFFCYYIYTWGGDRFP